MNTTHLSPEQWNQLRPDDATTPVKVTVDGHDYLITADTTMAQQTQILRDITVPTLIQLFLTLALLLIIGEPYYPLVSTIGDWTVASIGIVSSTVMSFILFLYRFFKEKHADIRWRNLPALAIGISISVLVITLFAFYLMDRIFYNIIFDPYLATVVLGVCYFATNYFVTRFALNLSLQHMIHLLLQVLVGGAVIAMVMNQETEWWKIHLSFLGSNQAVNSWQFNLTIVLSAALYIALIDTLFTQLTHTLPRQKSLTLLRLLLTAIGVSLIFVAYFKSDGPGNHPHLLELAASLMVIIVFGIMLGAKWLVPKMTRPLLQMTGLCAGGLLLLVFIFLLGNYMTLTAFEIISFVIAFTWVILLITHLNGLVKPPYREVTLTLTSSE